MTNDLNASEAKFAVGQLIHHKKFDYRGVIVDVDPEFHGPDEWYEHVARSRPPKEKPWYHVLVDDSDARTYVAERNLEPDETGEPIRHPEVQLYFDDLSADGYISRRKDN